MVHPTRELLQGRVRSKRLEVLGKGEKKGMEGTQGIQRWPMSESINRIYT